MKKLLIYIVSLFASASVFGQTIDSVPYFFSANDRGSMWQKKSNVPDWMIDGVRGKVLSNGDTIVRVEKGPLRAEDFGVYGDGTNMATKLQDAFDYGAMKFMYIAPDSSRIYSSSSNLNVHGKEIEFKGDGKLVAATSITIDSLTFTASDYTHVFDTLISFTHLKSTKGYITPNQLGAKMDGSANDLRYFVLGHKIAAENGLEFRVPSGTFYISGTFPLLSNGSLIGSKGSKINANPGTNFTFNGQMIRNLKIINNDFELIGSGTTNTSFFNLGTTGDSSYNITFNYNKIQAHRWGNYTVYVTGLRDSRFEGNEIDSSYNGSLYFEECWDTWIGGNRVTNAGRSGISGYRHNKRLNIYKNFVTGFSQNINLTDGGIDLYGPDNEDITVEGNIVSTGDSSLDGNFNHIPFRFQGFRRLKVINNTAICKSQYLLYAYRFSNRDDYESQDVEAYGNSAYITGYYSRIVSFQGTRNITFRNYHFKVTTTSTPSADPYVFYVADIPLVDTVRTLDLGGGDINMNGKAGTLLAWDTPVKDIIMSGTKVDSLNGNTYLYSTSYDAQSFTWLGGSINSQSTGFLFRYYNNIRVFNVAGLTITKPNRSLWFSDGTYTGTIVPGFNTINGTLAPILGGNNNRWSIKYNGAVNYTVEDTVGMVEGNRTGSNMNVTLPDKNKWPGRPVVVKNVSATRGLKVTNVAGGDKDSLITGEAVTYVADTSGWRVVSYYTTATGGGTGDVSMSDTTSTIATKYDLTDYTPVIRTLSANWGLQGGGNLTTNRGFNVDSSLVATRARLKHVTDSILALFAGYDTLTADFVQTGDSLILTIGDKRFAVFNQSSGGGGGGSPAGSTGDIQMNSSGAFAVATGLSRTGSGFNVGTRMNVTGRGYIDSLLTVRKNGLAASQLSSTFGLHVANETLATSGVPVQISPVFGMRGSGWNTTSSAANDVFFNDYVVPVNGASVSAYKLFRSQIAGGSQVEIGRWYNNGNFQVAGTMGVGSAPSGTAGTHPLVVIDGDVLKQISATYYAADNVVVKLTGNQTVAGIKTYSSIPVLPASNPTTDNQAVRKKYVDDLFATGAYDTVAYISNANYTFTDKYSAMVLSNASADRLVNLPAASSYVGRVLTVRNTSAYKITFNYAVTYNSTTGDAELKGGRWITMQARDAGWTVIAEGQVTDGSPTKGTYIPTINELSLSSYTVDTFHYTRIDDEVHVWGRLSVTTDASDAFTSGFIGIGPPIASTFTDAGQIVGHATAIKTSDGSEKTAAITADYFAGNRARFNLVKAASTAVDYDIYIAFDYKIR